MTFWSYLTSGGSRNWRLDDRESSTHGG